MFRAADFSVHREYCAPTATGRCLNWGLGAVGAAAAYARIAGREGAVVAPGRGVTVGFIDTGIDRGHWEFDRSRVRPMTILSGDGDASGTRASHGTSVASLVGARRGGGTPAAVASQDFHGIAWGADLKMFAIMLEPGRGDPFYTPVTVAELAAADAALWERLNNALADIHGVDILNMSFSFVGLLENYDEAAIRTALDDTIAIAIQPGRDDADKTLLVWSAGNENGQECLDRQPNCVPRGGSYVIDASSPTVANALQVFVEELRGHAVSVVATRRDGSLASFSNRCGVAAKWCIAAPGQGLLVAYYGPSMGVDGRRGYSTVASGTSFSAPLVAGGLAVLKHWFRDQLGNTELLARLYATADVTPDPVAAGNDCPEHLDLDGDPSDCELSSTHGRGLMDLDAATRPVGALTIVLGDALSSGGAPAPSSLLRGGGAAGGRALRRVPGARNGDLRRAGSALLGGYGRLRRRGGETVDRRTPRPFRPRGNGNGAAGRPARPGRPVRRETGVHTASGRRQSRARRDAGRARLSGPDARGRAVADVRARRAAGFGLRRRAPAAQGPVGARRRPAAHRGGGPTRLAAPWFGPRAAHRLDPRIRERARRNRGRRVRKSRIRRGVRRNRRARRDRGMARRRRSRMGNGGAGSLARPRSRRFPRRHLRLFAFRRAPRPRRRADAPVAVATLAGGERADAAFGPRRADEAGSGGAARHRSAAVAEPAGNSTSPPTGARPSMRRAARRAWA